MTESKKTIKNRKLIGKKASNDIARLKRIARKIMEHIEQMIEQYDATDENQKGHKNEWLFNGKSSLVGTLITLTDLLIKLEASGQGEESGNITDELEGLPLSKPDKKLLRQFIERQQLIVDDAQ